MVSDGGPGVPGPNRDRHAEPPIAGRGAERLPEESAVRAGHDALTSLSCLRHFLYSPNFVWYFSL